MTPNPDRRSFLKAGGIGLAGLTLAGTGLGMSGSHDPHKRQESAATEASTQRPMVSISGKKALVLWYSQTSNTARTGRCIASILEQEGFSVTATDYRKIDPPSVSGFDLIVAGSPVYYYDVPPHFQNWLKSVPKIQDKPVAAFVTFGGEGGNQHNTACALLDLLTAKGGAPVGLSTFGNMSTFAITWSTGNIGRIMKYSHLPDTRSYTRMADFARTIAMNMREGRTSAYEKNLDYREWIKGPLSMRGTRALINRHAIDKAQCVECGICVHGCPATAIDLESGTIDAKKCVACLGCVNNCPENAMIMEFLFFKVQGFYTFKKEHNIRITEPESWFSTPNPS